MKNEILTWLSQVPAQSLSMAAFAAVLGFSLLQWRAIVRLRRELQGDLAEVAARLASVVGATSGTPPVASDLPVLQPVTLSVTPPAPAPTPTPSLAPALTASLAGNPEPSHGGMQDYATAQRLAARGAHPDAIVERCGLSATEAHILVAMHEMKPVHR